MHNHTVAQDLLKTHLLGVADVCMPDFIDIFPLKAHRTDLLSPQIYSVLSIHQKQLIVSFFIEKNKITKSFHTTTKTSQRADFLWEEDCMELFFSEKNNGGYIEINATPDGRYNIYEFSGYRMPNTLPPIQSHHYQFTWLNANTLAWYHHQRFMITRKDNHLITITQFNPTAVLYPSRQNNFALYYANNHTQPPDFHQHSRWLKPNINHSFT